MWLQGGLDLSHPQKGVPPSAHSVSRSTAGLKEEGASSTSHLMITSEAVGSWLKSEWISAAALRKCRSRGPGVGGRLAAEEEEAGS